MVGDTETETEMVVGWTNAAATVTRPMQRYSHTTILQGLSGQAREYAHIPAP